LSPDWHLATQEIEGSLLEQLELEGVSEERHKGALADDGPVEACQQIWMPERGCEKVQLPSSFWLPEIGHEQFNQDSLQSSGELRCQDVTLMGCMQEGTKANVLAAVYNDRIAGRAHQVAVKRWASFGEQRAALEREARLMTLASSRCSHCVRYWGWFAAPDGAVCLVMKLYPQSLDARLESLTDRKMPLGEVRRLGKQIAQALAELHAQKVLFLDLKPSNVLLDEFDNIAICDFGSSRQSDEPRDSVNGLHGTFNYMPPEFFDQESFGAVSTKFDVWSFACCIVEMFAGRPPFYGKSMAVICYKVASLRETPGEAGALAARVWQCAVQHTRAGERNVMVFAAFDVDADVIGLTGIPSELPASMQLLLQQCFDFNSIARPCFRRICHGFDQEWNGQASLQELGCPHKMLPEPPQESPIVMGPDPEPDTDTVPAWITPLFSKLARLSLLRA
jgi:serine/threonine protein kinase